MKEPENLILRWMREIREDVGKLDAKVEKFRSEVLTEIRGLRKYLMGETIAARYVAVASRVGWTT
jgi:hypothetical protein